LICALVGLVSPAFGTRLYLGEGRDMDVVFQFQLWNTTTFEAVNDSGKTLENRNDTYVRRGRFGIRGHLRPDFRYLFDFAYDSIGKNEASAGTGNAEVQGTSNLYFAIWDAFLTYAIQADWLYFTAGYFRPQVGREAITTAFQVNSFPKALPNTYYREHIIGRSAGRETGVNLGGLHHGGGWGIHYNFGYFDTNHEKIVGDRDGGVLWSPLWTWRLAVDLGDPELESYDIAYKTNYFGQRNGITLVVNGTYQDRTNPQVDLAGNYRGGFKSNDSVGFEVLANFGPWNLSAEYDLMHRTFPAEFVQDNEAITAPEYTDRVWFVRSGFNIDLGNGHLLEPVAMYTRFTGDPHSAFYPNGIEEVLDFGFNWYQEKHRWKINLHFVMRDGEPISKYTDGQEAFGNYIGLGLQVVF
jgi:hypothetical protein